MKKILVTGGAGFIGSCFVQCWIKKHNIRLVNFDALTYAGHQSSIGLAAESPLYSFIQGDIRSFAEIERAINEHRPSMILHLEISSSNGQGVALCEPRVPRSGTEGALTTEPV